MKKRFLSLLSLILVFSLILAGINVTAAETGNVTVGSVSGKPGETIEVPVHLVENPGIVSLYLSIGYDAEVLKLNSITDSGLLPDYMAGEKDANPFAVSWELASATKNDESKGTLVILSFTILQDARLGDTEITVGQLTDNVPYDVDLNDVAFVYHAGKVTVEAQQHDHIYGNWTEIKKATCTQAGEEERLCTVEGCSEKETRIIPALGHEYGEWKTVVEATITGPGREERTCSRCDHVESREIPQIVHGEDDHIFNGRKEVLSEADCTHEGKNRVYCSVKGCDVYRDEIIPALGHKAGEWQTTKAPTCTENGLKEQICTVCQEKLGEEIINATGHSYGEWTVTKQPEIGVEGTRVRTCSICGYKEEQTIPAIIHGESDHVFDGAEEVLKEASCTENGILRSYCSFEGCNAYIDAEIPAKGHTEGEWSTNTEATCTESGLKEKFCAVCGEKTAEEILLPLGHTNGEWKIIKSADCTNNGIKERNCAVCSKNYENEIIPALGHDFGGWKTVTAAEIGKEGLEERICNRCQYKETRVIPAIVHEEADHIFDGKSEIIKEADCEHAGILRVYCSFEGCTAYQENHIAAKGHTTEEWKTVKEPTCIETGEKESYCKVCKKLVQSAAIPAKGHTYSDWKTVKEATFDKEGIQERMCEVCGDKLQGTIPKRSENHVHDFTGVKTVVKEATCTVKGLMTVACSEPNCSTVKEIELAAAGHSFGEWVIIKEPKTGAEGLKERSCTVCGVAEQEKMAALKTVSSDKTSEPQITGAVKTGDAVRFNEMMAFMFGAVILLGVGLVLRKRQR